MSFKFICKVCCSVSGLVVFVIVDVRSVSLPPPEDMPEEVLRTEIITQARSPVDGKSLSAAEYAQLQAQLQASPPVPKLSPEVRQNIFLLRLRKLIRTVIPFFPI